MLSFDTLLCLIYILFSHHQLSDSVMTLFLNSLPFQYVFQSKGRRQNSLLLTTSLPHRPVKTHFTAAITQVVTSVEVWITCLAGDSNPTQFTGDANGCLCLARKVTEIVLWQSYYYLFVVFLGISSTEEHGIASQLRHSFFR